MMHEREKSDPAVVAVKPVNNAERAACGAGGAKGGGQRNAEQHSTCRAQYRVSVSQALERIRQVRRQHPRWEPYAGKPHVRICAGGAQQ